MRSITWPRVVGGPIDLGGVPVLWRVALIGWAATSIGGPSPGWEGSGGVVSASGRASSSSSSSGGSALLSHLLPAGSSRSIPDLLLESSSSSGSVIRLV